MVKPDTVLASKSRGHVVDMDWMLAVVGSFSKLRDTDGGRRRTVLLPRLLSLSLGDPH